jgi:hypothetical protein
MRAIWDNEARTVKIFKDEDYIVTKERLNEYLKTKWVNENLPISEQGAYLCIGFSPFADKAVAEDEEAITFEVLGMHNENFSDEASKWFENEEELKAEAKRCNAIFFEEYLKDEDGAVLAIYFSAEENAGGE